MTDVCSLLHCRTEMEKLKAENAKLQEQLDIYEIRKEQMHMQVGLGTKTKLL